jgi:hypothetical protein
MEEEVEIGDGCGDITTSEREVKWKQERTNYDM